MWSKIIALKELREHKTLTTEHKNDKKTSGTLSEMEMTSLNDDPKFFLGERFDRGILFCCR